MPRRTVTAALVFGLLSSACQIAFANQKEPVLNCVGDEAQKQVEMFKTRPVSESACATHMWLQELQAIQRFHHTQVVIDVGCGKGFFAYQMFDLFAPELGLNKRFLYNFYTPISKYAVVNCSNYCNDDCDSVHNTPLLKASGRKVDISCVEPAKLHFTDLNKARLEFFDPPRSPDNFVSFRTVGFSQAIWRLYSDAIGREAGRRPFPKDCNDDTCSLLPQPSPRTEDVQVYKIDDIVEKGKHDRGHVLLLKITTEGYEPEAFEGMGNLFARKGVYVFFFEYSDKAKWKTTTLKATMKMMEEKGYACYYEGSQYLYKLTNGCWQDSYETKQLSQVVCGLGNSRFELMLDGFSYLRQLKADNEEDLMDQQTQPQEQVGFTF